MLDYPEFVVDVVHKRWFDFVLLEEHWYAYASDAELHISEGQPVQRPRDISDTFPYAYGTLSWDYTDGEATAVSVSDTRQTCTYLTPMDFADVNEILEEWAEAELDAALPEAASNDQAEKLLDELEAKEREIRAAIEDAEPALDDTQIVDAIDEAQLASEEQPDARGFHSGP